ncbi:hypothetical protein BDN72DRAFT_835514 [Pluteus cervinus]|uniref:Uncharacterized protein n=1 Tax=Pluteus cervinus TaxID=181527 RepID=A0ACD3B525_9AGAR|nr:hypothetical protein BDN72DRAFT_835514 [Pluteus cervinus]
MESGNAPAFEIGDTFGAMLVGAFISMAVYGITTLQTYFYFLYYPMDRIGTKSLVAAVWILDTFHVAFMCHAVYFYLVTAFNHREWLASGTWSLFASIGMNVLIGFVVQCFFTYHIYQLCSQKQKLRPWVTGIISFVVVAHFVLGMETVSFFFIKKDFARLPEVEWIGAMPFALTAILSDVLIAAVLCWLVGLNRSDFSDTNNLINKLTILAINRCLLTSAVAMIELIVFIALPKTFYLWGIDFIIGKLWANSFLATLNSRKALQIHLDTSTDTSISFNLHSLTSGDNRPTSVFQVPSRDISRRVRPSELDSKETASHSTLNQDGQLIKEYV